MFEDWSEFFLLVGTSAGALVGLLFVVATLAISVPTTRKTISLGTAFYMTPTLYNYATVLVISATGTMPGLGGGAMGLVLGLWSTAGAIYCGVVAVLMRRNRLPDSGHWVDVFAFGLLPGLVYLGLVAAAWNAWQGGPFAPHAIGIGLVVLIVLGIRNAWDLVTFIAPRSVEND